MTEVVEDTAQREAECDSCSGIIREGDGMFVTPRYVFCAGCNPKEAEE